MKQPTGWKIKNKRLIRDFKFRDFKGTLKFVNKVGKMAEQERHHPDIYFTGGKCRIRLYTHSINGLSKKDFTLAKKINKILR